MKKSEDKQKFVELRAKGLSFDNISREMGISKPTLIKWNDEFAKEISNLRFLDFESIITHYGLAKKARTESWAILLEKAIQELKNRSFEDFSVKDLLAIITQCNSSISNELSPLQYIMEEKILVEDDIFGDFSKPKTLPFVY